MTAQEWIERRANELATIKVEERGGKLLVIDGYELSILALAEYLDACGLKPLSSTPPPHECCRKDNQPCKE